MRDETQSQNELFKSHCYTAWIKIQNRFSLHVSFPRRTSSKSLLVHQKLLDMTLLLCDVQYNEEHLCPSNKTFCLSSFSEISIL